MNYAYIIHSARLIMREHGIIVPRNVDITHYIMCVIFFAATEKKILTAEQIAGRVVEIARYDYVATAARCGRNRVPWYCFGDHDVTSITAEDVI